jgi:hypothetical protein
MMNLPEAVARFDFMPACFSGCFSFLVLRIVFQFMGPCQAAGGTPLPGRVSLSIFPLAGGFFLRSDSPVSVVAASPNLY